MLKRAGGGLEAWPPGGINGSALHPPQKALPSIFSWTRRRVAAVVGAPEEDPSPYQKLRARRDSGIVVIKVQQLCLSVCLFTLSCVNVMFED